MQNLTKHSNRQYTISRKLITYSPKCTLSVRTAYSIKCTNLTWKNEKSRLLMPSSFHAYKQVCREFYTIRSLLLRSANDVCNFPKFNTVRNFSTSSVARSSDNKDDKKEHKKNQEDDKENKKDKQNQKEDEVDPWFMILKISLLTIIPLSGYLMLAMMARSMNEGDQMIKFISWQEFVYQMLLKGEVYKLDINKAYSTVVVHLYPGAVIDGKKRYMRCLLQVPDVDVVEEKIRKIERDYGISPADSVPITYSKVEKSWKTTQTTVLIILLILGWLASRFIKKSYTKQEFNKFLDSYFGRRAKFTLVDPQNKVGRGIRFDDVAGLEEAKVEVMEFVDYLKQPDRYKVLGAKIPKGVLLLGPPGCGKTLLAKAIANEANVPFLSMNGSEFIEMLGGLGAARVRSLFEQAKSRAPCIIYIDEIDAIGKKRRDNVVGHDELGMTLNQLLVELDGMSPRHDVILLASTNRPEVLDRALLRRGRFDRHIRIDLPTLSERAEIFKTHLKSIKLDKKPEVYSGYLAHLTPGFTGADIANICNESALAAASHKKHSVSIVDLTNAIDKVLSGTTKKSSVLSPSEKRIIAYREAGHVLVGWLLKHTDTFIKVSIVPTTRGKLGFSRFVESDQKIISKEQIFEEMCVNLAGRAAENLIFGQISTAAKDELKKVTTSAYAQVKEFGMNSTVGLLSFTKNELDMDIMPFSKKFKNVVDNEARKIIADACNKTNALLRENKDKLIKIAEELLIKESLMYEDIEKLIGPPPFGKKKILSYEDFQKTPINLGGPPVAEPAAT